MKEWPLTHPGFGIVRRDMALVLGFGKRIESYCMRLSPTPPTRPPAHCPPAIAFAGIGRRLPVNVTSIADEVLNP